MPRNETFWNPYRLIPAREKVERSAPQTDERFKGKSGMINCTLENLTPLFIGAQSSGSLHPPLLRNGRRVIPGTSLKGMLRSLAEIVGGGCFVVSDRSSPVPESMKTCSKISHLCIACRMFGAMESGRNAQVHKGKVSVSDAIIQEDEIQTKTLLVLLANNGVRHEPFYRSARSGNMDGKSRKVYFHQPRRLDNLRPIESSIRDRAWNIDALLPGHHFHFNVHFSNLSELEFSLLIYILHLEQNVHTVIEEEKLELKGPMRHKIGNAKPLGMGSCHIQLNKLKLQERPSERFRSMNSRGEKMLEGEALSQEITNQTLIFADDNSPTMQSLRKMMVWDENDPREFHYPSYHWFKTPANAGKALKPL